VLFDCHAHLIAGDPVRYPLVAQDGKPAARELEEPMTAERLLGEMDRNDVVRAVAVQRASIYGYDNSYVCDSAAKYPDRLVAVCAIDAVNPRGPEHVQHWVRERGAVGIRLMELVKGSDLSCGLTTGARGVARGARAAGPCACTSSAGTARPAWPP
jgi:L-fuconolactonase